jgi:hypothetical protein
MSFHTAAKQPPGSSPFGLQTFLKIKNTTSKGGMRGIVALNILQEIFDVDEQIVF